MIVKALSLWEPWASLMRYGAKRIETRSWPTDYRGPLLICASKRWTRELRQYAAERPYSTALAGRPCHPGMAVALVELVACDSTQTLLGGDVGGFSALPGSFEEAFGDYYPGRFGWCTRPICLDFEPFAVRGAQGLFEVHLPPEVETRVCEVAP